MQDTPAHWNSHYNQDKDFRLITSQLLSKVLEYADESLPKTCLDIGCGTGQLTRELYHRGYRCTGIDLSESAIQKAKELTIFGDKLEYAVGDIETINPATLGLQPYSLITCKLVYAFIQDKDTFLESVRKLLDPQGIFVVITPMVNDVEPAKKGITTSSEDIALLEKHFKKRTLFKDDRHLTYFVGSHQ